MWLWLHLISWAVLQFLPALRFFSRTRQFIMWTMIARVCYLVSIISGVVLMRFAFNRNPMYNGHQDSDCHWLDLVCSKMAFADKSSSIWVKSSSECHCSVRARHGCRLCTRHNFDRLFHVDLSWLSPKKVIFPMSSIRFPALVLLSLPASHHHGFRNEQQNQRKSGEIRALPASFVKQSHAYRCCQKNQGIL